MGLKEAIPTFITCGPSWISWTKEDMVLTGQIPVPTVW